MQNGRRKGVSITDIGNALEFEEAVEFGKKLRVDVLRDYMITVGKNVCSIIEKLTLE